MRFFVYPIYALAILSATIVLVVLGPVLWLPFVVRSLAAYSVLLLVHAVATQPLKGSTAALEESIAWYFVSIRKMLSNLKKPFAESASSRNLRPEQRRSRIETIEHKYDFFSWEFWALLFNEIGEYVGQMIWAAIFWAGTFIFLLYWGYAPLKWVDQMVQIAKRW